MGFGGTGERPSVQDLAREQTRENDVTRSWKVEYEGGCRCRKPKGRALRRRAVHCRKGKLRVTTRDVRRECFFVQISREQLLGEGNTSSQGNAGTREYFGWSQGRTSCAVEGVRLDGGLEGVLLKEVAKAGFFLVSKSVVILFGTLLTLFIQNRARIKRGTWAKGYMPSQK